MKSLMIWLLTAAAVSALSLDALAPNTWVKSPVRYKYRNMYPDTHGVYEWRNHYGSATYCLDRKELWAMDGHRIGDRWSIYSNVIYGFNPATDTVEMLSESHWLTNPGNSNYNTFPVEPYQTDDPTPCPRHVYECFTYVPSAHGAYLAYGANKGYSTCSDCAWLWHPKDMWFYSLATRKWRKIPVTLPDIPRFYDDFYDNHLCFVPGNDKLFLLGNTSPVDVVFKFDMRTETWSSSPTRNPISTGGLMDTRVVNDFERDRLVGFGGGAYVTPTNTLWAFYPARDSFSMITPSGTLPGPEGACGFAYNTKYDVFVMYGGGGTRTWAYLPVENRWESVTPGALPADTTLFWRNMVYDPVHDACLLQNSEGWYVFRYVRPGAPVADLSFLYGGGDGRVDFYASASTDADGNIVKYEWDFGYGWMKFNPSDTGKYVSHVFDSAGYHTVALRVTDNEGKTCIIADTTVYTAAASVFSNPEAGKGTGLSVYPNPCRDRLSIEASGPGAAISIYSVTGTLLEHAGADRMEWDTRGMPAGIYVVKAKSMRETLVKRIMLLK